MNTPVLVESARQDPVFHGGGFDILHFTGTKGGLQIATTGVGRLALVDKLSLADGEQDIVGESIRADLGYRGADAVREARTLWRTAIAENRSEEDIEAAHATFRSARLCYHNRGYKIGFRDWQTDPNDPSTLTARVIKVPFALYNRLSLPGSSEHVRAISEASGVAMALRTHDNRLIVQHRAVETVDLLTARKKSGNASYNDIPGASVAGLTDATIGKDASRKKGAPDSPTTESLTAHILKEAGEELGLAPEHISNARVVGIAQDNIKPHDEVLFLATTGLTAEEVREHSATSNRNKNLSPDDLAEKFLDIPATPEAIYTLLTNVKCPLPPTHAAAFVASGFMMVLEQTGSRVEAEAWASQLEKAVQDNYTTMDLMVRAFYEKHPEALHIIPERMWGKSAVPRNPNGYSPHYTPTEQGLPELEDELVRTDLVREARREISVAKLFDVDGVLVDPQTKEVSDVAILAEIADCLKRGEPVGLNTGRSATWVEEKIVTKLRAYIDDPEVLKNFMVIGEKGGTWITYAERGDAIHGQAPDLKISEDIRLAVRDLVNTKYSDCMFFDSSKQTMLSIEMHDKYDLEQFAQRQKAFALELGKLLEEKQSSLKIDATTIATDIESPHVGKALGAERFMQLLKDRDVVYKKASFTAYGDSPSDVAMADELERRGLKVTFVFLGDPAKLDPNNRYPIVVNPDGKRYDRGALAHLRDSRKA
jgi:hypothetical protein